MHVLKNNLFAVITALIILCFIAVHQNSFSAPPHPRLIEKYRSSNDTSSIKNIMQRAAAHEQRRRAAMAKRKVTPSPAMKIPVILVSYATPSDSASAPAAFSWPQKPAAPAFAYFIITLSIITALVFIIRRYSNGHRPAWALSTCFLIFFSCTGFFSTDTQQYHDLLNSSSAQSVKKYYADMSNNTLDLQFDVFGPVIVSKPYDYYGKNNRDGIDMYSGELVHEAVQLLICQQGTAIDFSVYDNDSDGYVDTVMIIHEGPGEEYSGIENHIWSHQFTLSAARDMYNDGAGKIFTDGVTIDVYTIQPEYNEAPGDTTIGIYCHEFGHVLGLPDMYDTSGETSGVGDWSLMSSGSYGGPNNDGSQPAPLLAWERLFVGGSSWLTVHEVNADSTQTVDNIEAGRTVFKIPLNDPDKKQYLLIEGKQASLSGQWFVPGTGLLVTHIHEGVISAAYESNTVNDSFDYAHGVNIVEANSGGSNTRLWTDYNYTGSALDLFHNGNKEQLTDSTIPNTRYYTDNTVTSKTGFSGVSITGISVSTFPMTMHIDVP